MLDQRKYVISIAGFDPSAGAGVLADIKCFEQHQVYGFGVCSALTVQTDDLFTSVQWLSADQIIAQLAPLMVKFEIAAIKIGLIKDISVLEILVNFIRASGPKIKLVLDPVLKSSSGFEFHEWNIFQLAGILEKVNLITPNYEEMKQMGNQDTAEVTAAKWSKYCPVLLKGGHNPVAPGTDLLFITPNQIIPFNPETEMIYQKHGSGCVLSASILANMALGQDLATACHLGKAYTARFLNSNSSLLGDHHHAVPAGINTVSIPVNADYPCAKINKNNT